MSTQAGDHPKTHWPELIQAPSALLARTEPERTARVAKRLRDDGGKILATVLVLKEASRTIGTTNGARQWLLRPLCSFGGVPPLSLLDTSAGFDMVRQGVQRIEHGVCA